MTIDIDSEARASKRGKDVLEKFTSGRVCGSFRDDTEMGHEVCRGFIQDAKM